MEITLRAFSEISGIPSSKFTFCTFHPLSLRLYCLKYYSVGSCCAGFQPAQQAKKETKPPQPATMPTSPPTSPPIQHEPVGPIEACTKIPHFIAVQHPRS